MFHEAASLLLHDTRIRHGHEVLPRWPLQGAALHSPYFHRLPALATRFLPPDLRSSDEIEVFSYPLACFRCSLYVQCASKIIPSLYVIISSFEQDNGTP